MWKIRIEESRLSEIIRESLDKVIGQEPVDDIIANFDLSNYPEEDLRQIARDLRYQPIPKQYGSPFSKINEALNDILPPDDISKAIMNRYKLPQSTVDIYEFYHQINVYILVAQIGENLDLITNDMENAGYFLSTISQPKYKDGITYYLLQFEPKSIKQEDITDEIKKKYNYLYHWTPKYNLDSIFRNGLIPCHKNKSFNFPDRTYLIEENANKTKILELGNELSFRNTNKRNNEKYALLKISITNLDDSTRFFYDPNSEIGIYTEQAISNDNIMADRYIDFSVFRKK